MPGPSSTVSIRPLHPSGPNVLHMPTAGSTVRLVATAFDNSGLIVSTSFTWSSDNASVATVNSGTGLVTGVANGICNIQAQANDSGAAKNKIAVGVALLSANTISLAYGSSTTISSVGGFDTANWFGGCPGAAEVRAGIRVNGFIVNSANPGLGSEPGPIATIFTPVYQGPTSFTATAHVPIFANVGGIYCSATANITGVPNWSGA